MAQQPVNFEQERQRILAEIEARAKERGGELTLQDWLKAAEEVMPNSAVSPALSAAGSGSTLLGTDELGEDMVSLSSTRRAKRRSRSRTRTRKPVEEKMAAIPTAEADTPPNQEDGDTMGSKNTIWMSVISGTVLAAVLGAGGLGFYTLHNEMKKLSARLDTMEERLNQLEQGKGQVDKPTLDTILARLDALEKKAFPVDAQQKVSDQVHSELTQANVVTEAVLDAKLAQFSQRIEQVIDKRFATLLVQLKSLRTSAKVTSKAAPPAQVQAAPSENASEPAPLVAVPTPPAEPKVPEIKPKVTPKVAGPSSNDSGKAMPSVPRALLEAERWLAQQPPGDWTLQLASVLDKASLDHMIRNKQLHEAKIIRQVRDGQTRYVLVQGSFPDRAQEKQAAQAIRARTGINPWVRNFKPLQANLPH